MPPQTPTVDLSTFTDEQKKLFAQAASLGSGITATNNGTTYNLGTPSPYTPEALTGSIKPLNVPPPPVSLVPDTSQLDASISQLVSGNTPEQSAAEAERGGILDSIRQLLERQSQETARRGELEVAAGVPEQNKAYNELLQQIRQNNASAFESSQLASDRLAPNFAIQGEQSRIERLRAVKNYGLAAAAEAITGNIALAQDNIQRALDAEFKPLEKALEYQKLFLESNRNELARADSKAAQELEVLLNERTRILQEAREEREYVQNTMLEAARAGAPADVLQRIQNSTPEDAIALTAQYLGADFARQAAQTAFDNDIKLRGLDLQERQAQLSRRQNLLTAALAGDQQAIRELGYDPNDLPLGSEEVQRLEGVQTSILEDIDIVDRALRNNTGLSGVSGLVRGTGALGFLSQPLVPYAATQRNNFLADATYIIKNLTFDKITDLSERGVKLTPISEKELKAMADASAVLASAAEFDDAGNLLGFKISDKRVQEEFQKVRSHYQSAFDEITVDLRLTPSEQKEITRL